MKKIVGVLLLLVAGVMSGKPAGLSSSDERLLPLILSDARELDLLLSTKRGETVFAINAPIEFKKKIKTVFEKQLGPKIDKIENTDLKQKIQKLLVMQIWYDQNIKGWLGASPSTLKPDQKKHIGKIMDLYAKKSNVLFTDITRLIAAAGV